MCINTCNFTLMKYLMPTFFSLREAHRDPKKRRGGLYFQLCFEKTSLVAKRHKNEQLHV